MQLIEEYGGPRTAVGIAEWLRRKILSGVLFSGMKLPSVREAGEHWGLDRNTVQKAYKLLESEELVEARGSAGTVVRGDRRFPWRRLWWPVGEMDEPHRWTGFLVAPDEESSLNAAARTLENLDEPVLILLGEAGLGKSDAVCAACAHLNERRSGSAVVIDLAGIGSKESLLQQINSHPDINVWLSGKGDLTLFLDGFDEGWLRHGTLARDVAECLQKFPSDRLRVRITCRTCAWYDDWEHELAPVNDGIHAPKLRLLELTQDDVEIAANSFGIDPARFLQFVRDRKIAHLANRPLTLNMLLRASVDGPPERISLVGLFRDGIQGLLSEADRPREVRGVQRRLTTPQRFGVASRIAAMSILCNRPIFGEAEIDVINRLNVSESGSQPIGVSEFKEIVQSGIFTTESADRFRFAHRSFAEFMAADFLSRAVEADDRLWRLITVQRGGDYRVPSGLRETASWVAVMNRGVFDRLLEIEPDVLLLTDTIELDVEQKNRLVERYLELIAEGKLSDERCRSVQSAYGSLHYEGLDELLGKIIAAKDSAPAAREIAIEIAGDCGGEAIARILVDLALNDRENVRTRFSAAYALRWLHRRHPKGIRKELNRLKPLLEEQIEGDQNQELLGCALHLLWPESISAEELFDVLKPQARSNHYGAYSSFLMSSDFLDHLKVADLRIALKWAQRQKVDRGSRQRQLDHVVAALLHKAWLNIDEIGIADLMAPPVLARLERVDSPFYSLESGRFGRKHEDAIEILDREPEKRERLLTACVNRLGQEVDHLNGKLIRMAMVLARRSDLNWILNRALTGPKRDKGNWARVANLVFNQIGMDQISEEERESVINAIHHKDRPAELLAYLNPVEIDSPHADELRKHDREMKSYGRPPRKRRKSHTLRQILESWIQASTEHNESEAWRPIHQVLVFGREWDDTETQMIGAGAGVIECALWESADKKLRQHVIEAAKLFVQNVVPTIVKGIEEAEWDGSMWESYEALRLLQSTEPEFLAQRPAEWWDDWAPLVVAFRKSHCDELDEALAELAYRSVGETCRRIANDMLRGASGKDREEDRIRRFAGCADAAVLDVIETFLLQDGPHGPNQLRTLLDFIAGIDSERAKRIGISFLDYTAGNDVSRSQSLAAAIVLTTNMPRESWEQLERILGEDPMWGRDFLGQLVNRRAERRRDFATELDDAELGRLLAWVYEILPLGPQREHGSGVYTPTIDDELYRWRSDFINYLVNNRPGAEIEEALLGLCRRHPENGWFLECLRRFEDRQIEDAWQPLSPEGLVTVLNYPKKRGVTNDAELAQAVLESLQRFEHRLQTQAIPLRDNLWDDPHGKAPKPKNEEHFSNNLRDHLSLDLPFAVANREVQVLSNRQHPDDEVGKRLDLLIQTIDGKVGPLSVVVEVKLDTNKDVVPDLGRQLGERYLHERRWTHGIYCVGWTGASRQWNSIDILEATLQQAQKSYKYHRPQRELQIVVVDCSLHQSMAAS